jgi:primosomal protein N' (replication factor Y)
VNAVNTHEKILERFKQNHTPVLIGTQMVAKGLNLPDVTLVGVLDGDLNLYMGGYRAAETTFNMLTQVVGRAGRFGADGKAMIQTLSPEHKVIQLASRQDYDGFYDMEIRLREVQQYPPFGDLANITFSGRDEAQVLRSAMAFCQNLKQLQTKGTVLGPAPCPVPKINYHYRYQLTVHCKADRAFRQLLAYLLRQFMLDKANRGVSAFADVNGFE